MPGRVLLPFLDGTVHLRELARDFLQLPPHGQVRHPGPFLRFQPGLRGGEHLPGQLIEAFGPVVAAVRAILRFQLVKLSAHPPQVGKGPLRAGPRLRQIVRGCRKGDFQQVRGVLLQRALHLNGLQLEWCGTLRQYEELPLHEFHAQKTHPADDGNSREGKKGAAEKFLFDRHKNTTFPIRCRGVYFFRYLLPSPLM